MGWHGIGKSIRNLKTKDEPSQAVPLDKRGGTIWPTYGIGNELRIRLAITNKPFCAETRNHDWASKTAQISVRMCKAQTPMETSSVPAALRQSQIMQVAIPY